MALKLIIKRQGASSLSTALEERTFVESIVTIGSDRAASLYLNDQSVAPEQAVIIDEDGELLLINRADNTRLNHETLPREARRPIADGDTLYVGTYTILCTLAPTPPRVNSSAAESRAVPESARSNNGAPAAGVDHASVNSFAAILDSLRTEEDSFYFQIETPTGEGRRHMPIESAEMIIGWDAAAHSVSFDAARVDAPRAVVRKDWSGVVVQPQGAGGMLAVNGTAITEARRLRNGDRLTLQPLANSEENQVVLVFHEPASLVVLDSLLPHPLPPPVVAAPALPAQTGLGAGEALASHTPAAAKSRAEALAPDRRFFGYFTLAELLIMSAGTLVSAVIIFLILEYS